MRGAELVFCLFDTSATFSDEDAALCELLTGIHAPKIALLNKLDVKRGVFTIPARYRALFCEVIEISAKSGEGLDRLRTTVEDLFSVGAIETTNDAVVTNARQFAALTEASACVGDAIHAAKSGMGAGCRVERPRARHRHARRAGWQARLRGDRRGNFLALLRG